MRFIRSANFCTNLRKINKRSSCFDRVVVVPCRLGHSSFEDSMRIKYFVHQLNSAQRSELLKELQTEGNLEPEKPSTKPTFRQLKYVALYSGIPFIGFGILDNTIMLTAGEYIDFKFGAMLGISTLAAAALGNMLSDIVGVGTAGVVEQTVTRMGLPSPSLTSQQLQMTVSRRASTMGRAVGVTLGCVIGMWPLLLLSDDKKEDAEEAAPT